MKSPDRNPRWARSPWTTNCCPPRSPPWRPKTLWPEGGRDDEPDGLAFHVSLLWLGAGLARVECSHGRQHGRTRYCERPTNPAWSKKLACAEARCTGTGRSRVWPAEGCRRSVSGRRGVVADDARTREV